MTNGAESEHAPVLRTGWTTGACATAALRAALIALWGPSGFPRNVVIDLPHHNKQAQKRNARFTIAYQQQNTHWCEAGVIKDAGDDPDVTHGALIIARVQENAQHSIRFHAGSGIGIVTKPGLPVAIGQAAINPVPKRMMQQQINDLAQHFGKAPGVDVTLSIPNGDELAQKTWNPRLGIVGGLSILGTTGIVRPFSCSAWIASIYRGIDVAVADHLGHIAACTGATSERAVQSLYDLPVHAMIDMGNFVGGTLKYLRTHPVPRLTLAGGLGKMAKLAQGALDLHNKRSQIDMPRLVARAQACGITYNFAHSNSVAEAYASMNKHAMDNAGAKFAHMIACDAYATAVQAVQHAVAVDVVIADRQGGVIAHSNAPVG